MTDPEIELGAGGAEPDATESTPLGLRDASVDVVISLFEGMDDLPSSRKRGEIRTALGRLFGSGRAWAAPAEVGPAMVRGPASPVQPATLRLRTDRPADAEPSFKGRAVLGRGEVRVWIAHQGVPSPGISLALVAVDRSGQLQVSEPVALGDPGQTVALALPWPSEDIPAPVLVAFTAAPGD